MPIYEFKCSSCDHLFNDIVKFDVKENTCEKCGKVALKIFSVSKPWVSLGAGCCKNTDYKKVNAPPPISYLPNGDVVTCKPIYGNKAKNK